MTKATTILHSQQQLCYVCKKPATITPIEGVPGHGLYVEATHEDGSTHNWKQFDSIEEIGRWKRKETGPIRMKCPKCGKRGIVNQYRKSRTSNKIGCYIRHQKKRGTWGIKSKVRRYDRCFIIDPEQRNLVLKKLGRYIRR